MPHQLLGLSEVGSQNSAWTSPPTSDFGPLTADHQGAVAQLGEHLLCKEGVRSSSLLGSTITLEAISSSPGACSKLLDGGKLPRNEQE